MRGPRSRAKRAVLGAAWLVASAGAIGLSVSACHGWDPLDPFQHDAPTVDEAIVELDAGQYRSAEQLLAEYLKTGVCGDAGIGLPDEVHQKPNGTFDLGLTLFHLAEKFGNRFGDEENDAGGPGRPEARAAEVACALAVVRAIAQDPKVPPDLRARAFYLAGNLAFLSRDYQDAVKSYDAALAIAPGLPLDAGGDAIGRDAAHNRAIALRRLEDQDAGDDGGDAGDGGGDAGDGGDGAGPNDGGNDGGDDDESQEQSQGPDAGDGGQDAGADGSPDAGGDAGGKSDDGKDQADAQAPAQPQPLAPEQGAQQDDRMLDRLEEAPSYQQQEARARAGRRRGRAMEDK